ncbi:MAG: site-2 protease family protein [Cyanobacteria bacterium P01_F01_bin.42]
MIIFLAILGVVLYFIVQYQVAPITQTPVWLLWFVLMIPAFVLGIWGSMAGDIQDIPLFLVIISLIVSSITYISLVQAGRKAAPEPEAETSESKPVRLIDSQEEKQLQNCFSWSTFYLQNIDHFPQAVICRGQLKTEPESAYAQVQKNISKQFGDRFLVSFQNSLPDQTFFAIVPNPHRRQRARQSPMEILLALGLMLATVITTAFAGLVMDQPQTTPAAVAQTPELLRVGLPYSLALMAILGVHELGHYCTARFYRLKASLPFFIPYPFFAPSSFFLGTFGAFIRVRSPMPDRKTLFDVGIAGPIAGLVVALPLLVFGLDQSTLVTLPSSEETFSTDAVDPKISLLFFLLARLICGSELTASQGLDLHPLAIAGGLGLLITALNLIPVGQLDGGHIVHAMYGRRTALIVGQVSRLLLLVLSFVQQPILFLWAIILMFMPAVSQPALNDVSELNNGRDVLGLLALVLLVVIILRAPVSLVDLLASTNPLP